MKSAKKKHKYDYMHNNLLLKGSGTNTSRTKQLDSSTNQGRLLNYSDNYKRLVAAKSPSSHKSLAYMYKQTHKKLKTGMYNMKP